MKNPYLLFTNMGFLIFILILDASLELLDLQNYSIVTEGLI